MLEKIDLQLFAEELEDGVDDLETEDVEEFEDDLNDDLDDAEDSENDSEEAEPKEKPKFSQEQQVEINKIIDKVFGKKRSKWEQEVTGTLGVNSLKEAVDYVHAGRAVSGSAKVPPSEIVNRLQAKGLYNPTQGSANDPDKDGLRKDIDDIKAVLYNEREEKVRSIQEQEAIKSFGNKVYRDNEMDIKEKADEMGISLVDAAAIVLRPKLSRIAEERAKAKKADRSRRSLDSGDAGTSGNTAVEKLSQAQKKTAQRMGLSYKDYYDQLKELGRI